MAKQAAWRANLSVNSVALEDELTSIDLKVEQETIVVTGFSNTGPERVVGNYDYSHSLAGNFDGAASQGDATLFALIGSSGVAVNFDPTGASAGANDPNYDATSAVLKSYSIKAAVGAAVTYAAELEGNSALARSTA